MTAHPAAYLRRSYVDANSPGDISREAQRDAVRRLSTADGHNGDVIEYDDWGVSADVAKSAKRTAYTRLLADMEAGKVSSVYAFDMDRLYRDPRDLIRLQDAAQRHKVRIVTTGGPLSIGDGDDPAAEGFAFIGAVFGRMELQKAKKRSRATRDARLARGDTLGRPAYGYRMARADDGRVIHEADPSQPIAPVIDAFRTAGSFGGAAHLLNAAGVPSPRGGSWTSNVIGRIVRREAPEMLRATRVARGVRVKGNHTLARLLVCPCGQLMTGRWSGHRTKYGSYRFVSYQCFKGRYDARHQRPYMVNEKTMLPLVQAEVAHLDPPDAIEADDNQADSERSRLLAAKERLGWAVADGLLGRDQARTRSAEIDAKLDGLEVREKVIEVPEIDWSWSPRLLNDALTAIFDRIELGPDLRPVRFVWRVPEWRRR